jgi:pimeloyl-ACP methyl ester carboxylesterase
MSRQARSSAAGVAAPAHTPELTAVRTPTVALGARHWPGSRSAIPVLLVHGLSSNARLWDAVAARLPAHPVLAPDLRGHATSAAVPDPPDTDPTAVAVADLAGACASLGWSRVLVAGQSWGGNIGLQLAREHPDLVAGLVLVDGGWLHLGDRWSDPDDAWRTLKPPNLTGWALDDLRTVLTDAHPDWSAGAVEATLANLEHRPDGTVRPWLTLERHRDRVASLLAHQPRRLYPNVHCPTVLLVAGEPPDAGATEAAAALPAADLVTFPGGDHDLHAQHPARVAAAIQRLTGREAATTARTPGSPPPAATTGSTATPWCTRCRSRTAGPATATASSAPGRSSWRKRRATRCGTG